VPPLRWHPALTPAALAPAFAAGDAFAISAQSAPNQRPVSAQSARNRSAIGAQSERNRSATGAQPERTRSAPGAQSKRRGCCVRARTTRQENKNPITRPLVGEYCGYYMTDSALAFPLKVSTRQTVRLALAVRVIPIEQNVRPGSDAVTSKPSGARQLHKPIMLLRAVKPNQQWLAICQTFGAP